MIILPKRFGVFLEKRTRVSRFEISSRTYGVERKEF